MGMLGVAGRVALAKTKTASASDVTPNAVDWSYVAYNSDTGNFYYTERQITGISGTITLKVQLSGNLPSATFYYLVSNAAGAVVSGDGYSATQPFYTSLPIVNNGTFTVSNGQYVTFSAELGSCFDSGTCTVINQSDANTTLDSFLIVFEGEC
jgi:hypothetical protein